MTSLSLTILRDGQKTEVACTNEVADMLQSEETDDAVKELIIRQLVGQNSASTSSRSSVEKVTEENDTSVKWTKAAEKLLLEENKKVEDRGKPLKNKWKQIAGAIESFGFKFTADQCRLKFRGLKDKYERQKKRANTSGEAGIDVDTQLEDCFETLPDVKPLAVLDTDVEATKSRAVDAVKVDLSDNESTSADVETQPKKRRRSSTVTDDLKAFLKDESERREAAQERRHKEKIDVTMSLVTVLRDLAQK